MIKVFVYILGLTLAMGTSDDDDVLKVLVCDPVHGDHVIPSPEFCDR